nr:C25 family cysteine peptidase [Chryseobacterium sp. PCH239]
MGQAQRIASYHQTKNNYKVEIVDINKIYEEYGSGSKDLTAIRDFVSKLNTPLGRLQYVFILGDASYDYKTGFRIIQTLLPATRVNNLQITYHHL